MANLSNINNKFLVTTGGHVIIGSTSDYVPAGLQVSHGSGNGGILLENTGTTSDMLLNIHPLGLIWQRWLNGAYQANLMTLDYNGNLLIGTTSTYPQGNDTILKLYSTSVPRFYLQNTTTGSNITDGSQIYVSGSDLYITNSESANTIFSTNSLQRMRITSTGNVGIGVTPTASGATTNLEMVGGSTFASRNTGGVPQLYISSNGVGQGYTQTYKQDGYATQYVMQGYDGGHLFSTAVSGTAGNAITYNPRLVILNNGDVGINKVDPSYKLDVEGDVRLGGTNAQNYPIKMGRDNHAIYLGGPNINTMNVGWDTNSDYNLHLNYNGYAGGVTQFRNLVINDGKQGHIATFKGSTGCVGIGTDTPASYYAKQLVVKCSSNENGISIIANGTADSNYLMFGDGISGPQRYEGYIEFNHSTNLMSYRSSGEMRFLANSVERMRIDSSGNVGIGVIPANWNTITPIQVKNSAFAGLTSGNTHVAYMSSNFFYQSGDKYIANGQATIYTQANGKHSFYSAPENTSGAGAGLSFTESLRITSAGQVQVGYYSTARGGANTTFMTGKTGTTYLELNGGDVNGEGGILFADGSGGNYGLINYSHVSDLMQFYTASSERMRITSNGTVGNTGNTVLGGGGGEGVTGWNFAPGNGTIITSSSGDSNMYLSKISGYSNNIFVSFYVNSSYVGKITTNGSSTSYVTTSDYRLKENVVGMTGALDRVSQLKPSRFNFIADADKTVDGFLAHEVQEIVPEAISGEKDAVDEEGNPDYQGIDQSKLVPLLVAAIQELKAEIELLKSK